MAVICFINSSEFGNKANQTVETFHQQIFGACSLILTVLGFSFVRFLIINLVVLFDITYYEERKEELNRQKKLLRARGKNES